MKLTNPFSYTARISQYFGENPQIYARFRMDGHNGVDFAIPENTELFACINGVVSQIGYDPTGYGNYIRIHSNEGAEVICAHLNQIFVAEGTTVTAGQRIGLTGNTGFSTGPHLHFGLRFLVNGVVEDYRNGYYGYKDPISYFDDYEVEQEETFHGSAPKIEEEKEVVKVEELILPQKELPSDWAEDGYAFVTEEGVSNGERPRDLITREEFWLTLYRFAAVLEYNTDLSDDFGEVDFSRLPLDQRPSEWAEFAYLWVKDADISNGARPKEYISREEIWTMLYRFFQEETVFIRKNVEVSEESSEWARLAQNWVVANNISNGERPFDFITREEIWVMLDRLDENLSN